MKNTTKKALSAAMAVAMMAGMMSGCSKDQQSKGDTYLIGASGPLTGEYASYGTSVQNGAQLAVKAINAAGGLNGVNFSFEMKDDQGDPEKAQNGFNSLYGAGMKASIGSVTSGACVAFATAAKENDVFVITPSSSDAKVIAVGDNVFRVCFGDPDQGKIAAEELSQNYQKIGALYDTSIDYSKGIFEAFEAELQAQGKVKDTDYVAIGYPEDTSDFSTYIDQLQSAGCDVVFLPIYYEAAGLIAKAAAQKNYNVPIFGSDGLDGVKSQIDETVTAPISYITPFDSASSNEAVSKFVKDYQDSYGAEPDQFAADGYDAVMVIYEAMKQAGVKDASISPAELNKILVETITSADFSYSGLTGSNMKWDASGACAKEPFIVEVTR